MREPTSVTVYIHGQSYTLKGGNDPAYVQEVAAYVDERMKEVSENSSISSATKVAILAAVNIADELFREQQKRIQALATLEDRSVQIARLLDNEVSKDFADIQKDSLPGT